MDAAENVEVRSVTIAGASESSTCDFSTTDYDCFLQFQASQSSILGRGTFLASKDSSWIIDSGVTSHMTSTRD